MLNENIFGHTKRRATRFGRGLGALMAIAALTAFALMPKGSMAANQTVVIGGLLDFTGPAASYGEVIRRGMQLAADEINAKAGGKRIELSFADSKCSAEGGIAGFRKLADVEKAQAVLTMCSPVISAVVPLAERGKVIAIDVAANTGDLWLKSKLAYTFSIAPKTVDEYSGAGRFVYDTVGARTAVTLSANTQAGQAGSGDFSKAFEERGGKVLRAVFYPQATGDFRDYVVNAMRDNPDTIVIAGHTDEGSRVALALKEAGYKGIIFGNTASVNKRFAAFLGDKANGIVASLSGFDPTSTTPAAIAFVKAFQGKYGSQPDFLASNGYEAVYMMDQAVSAPNADSTVIAANLRNIKFQGPSGQVAIQENGLVRREPVFKMLKDGNWIPYAR